MSVNTSVWVTLAGDAGSAEVQADTAVAIATLLPGWAAQVSTAVPEDLVVVSEDTGALVDPEDSLAAIGAGYGAVLRLATPEAAMALLDVANLEAPASPEPDAGAEVSERTSESRPRPADQLVAQGLGVGPPTTAPPEPPAPAPGATPLPPWEAPPATTPVPTSTP